ncbi:MAG: hypothetical protein PHS84_10700 [Paludibacter sp.]|nr:hypothetical protein [Paludibacter sp.]
MRTFLMAFTVFFVCSFSSTAQQKAELAGSTSNNNLQAISLGVGISHGTSYNTGFVSVGFLNEFGFSHHTSLILGGNIINSTYEIGPLNTNRTYGIQISISAEGRCYLSNKNSQINKGWFIGLPLEIFSSNFMSATPLLAPSIGYRLSLSNRILLETAAGMGLSLRDFQTFDAVPYLRLKACYAL